MSALRSKSPSEDLRSLRHRSNIANVEVSSGQADMSLLSHHHKKALSSSLDSIRILPRAPAGSSSAESEEVELTLLSEEERASAALDGDVQTHTRATTMSSRDRKAMTLLIILCLSLYI